MDFKLVPKSMTLNDNERLNSLYLRYSTEFGSFGRQCWRKIKWLKTDTYYLQQKCITKNIVFSNMWLIAIVAEITENECINDRHQLSKAIIWQLLSCKWETVRDLMYYSVIGSCVRAFN